MKKVLYTIIFIVSIHSTFAKTTKDSVSITKKEYKKNLFSFYPFGLIGNNLLVSYERRITTENAIRGVFGFGSAENSNIISKMNDLLEIYGEIQFRIYPILIKKDNLNYGFYVAPYLLAKTRKFNQENTTRIDTGNFSYITNTEYRNTAQTGISGGVIVGYNLMLLERISFDFYLGGGMMYLDVKTPNDIRDIAFNEYSSGVKIQIGLNIGISF